MSLLSSIVRIGRQHSRHSQVLQAALRPIQPHPAHSLRSIYVSVGAAADASATKGPNPANVVRFLLFGGILTGGVFSYSLFTSKLQQQGALITTPAPASTEGDYGAVRSAVANILDKDDYDDGSYGPVLVRLAWHASGTYDKASNTGGSNGSTMR
ncbi:PEROXIDASE_4 domain-containing protein [Haematococcus lacustris]|uniref:PEROXIDASE_4 domain-containing protein n=1 Tax=Haematococcus lacustris TaxID=44745 RepID=A0A699ZKJ8_HAELA|nr:PEROXIDASE_4 domain-containing protein [Haematococcus lacustris]